MKYSRICHFPGLFVQTYLSPEAFSHPVPKFSNKYVPIINRIYPEHNGLIAYKYRMTRLVEFRLQHESFV